MGLNPLQYNPYTQPLWAAAVAQYDRIMSPVEQKIAGKLRSQFKGLDGYPQQVSMEKKKHCTHACNYTMNFILAEQLITT